MQRRRTYRADIQGLRAVAVLLVLTFHAGLPVVGGFIGVDVFFVISGYVITQMLLREWNTTGSISLVRFWRRRFFRLSPALALVIAVTFIFSALILLPLQQQTSYQTGIGALFFVANIVIARNTGGYFDAPAENNPLLNTWSLSVEEQFYFFFPLLVLGALILGRKVERSRLLPYLTIGSVALVSLALAIIGSRMGTESPTWINFYSPVTRSWEFAIGSLLALWGRDARPPSPGTGRALRWIGGTGLVCAAFVINETTPFPGPWTLLPVIATGLLLVGGSAPGSPSKILTHPSLVRIGDWSYSIYLWHWPVIVFTVALGITAPIWLFVAALVSFVPAVLSYRFVETPLRHWDPKSTGKRIGVAVGVLVTPVLLVPILSATATPLPRFNGTVGVSYLETIWATSHDCELEQTPNAGSRCFQSKPSQPTDLLIIGDSHAEDLYLGFSRELPDLNVEYVYLPGWPFTDASNFRSTMEQVQDASDLRAVIINARWEESVASHEFVVEAVRGFDDIGVPVFIADDRPKFSFHAERCQYEPLLGYAARCEESSSRFESRYEIYMPILQGISQNFDQVHILKTSEGYCSKGTCSMVRGDDLLFADDGHLNEIGSTQIAAQVLAQDADLRAALAD